MSKKHKNLMRRLQSGQEWPRKAVNPGARVPVVAEEPVSPKTKDDGGFAQGGYITFNTPSILNFNSPWITYDEQPKPKPSVTPEMLQQLRGASPRFISRHEVADYTQIITAWRAWAVTPQDGRWLLSALGVGTIWEPHKPMTANCKTGPFALRREEHIAPKSDCSCGIWSFKSDDELLKRSEDYRFKVFGQVSIWGRVIECEFGYRAQFAYPKELWLLDSSLEELGYTYGVPVRTI